MEAFGIDPGLKGAMVLLSEKREVLYKCEMPLCGPTNNYVDTAPFRHVLDKAPDAIVFLEKSIPFAMNVSAAFNYGAHFGQLELLLRLAKRKVVLCKPNDWTKVMYAAYDKNLKPKAKAIMAKQDLYPKVDLKRTDRCTNEDEGMRDALLIAHYGLFHYLKRPSEVAQETCADEQPPLFV